MGPAGTGKTYLAVSKAVEALESGQVGRIVLSRPAVEAGEHIGFLPGALEEKLAPYLRPLYDALADRLSPKRLKALMAEGLIEIAPIAYMRGRTLNNAYIVVDEAQNCTYGQLKMLLTRLGWNSTMYSRTTRGSEASAGRPAWIEATCSRILVQACSTSVSFRSSRMPKLTEEILARDTDVVWSTSASSSSALSTRSEISASTRSESAPG